MLIPGLSLLQTYFVVGFGLGVILTIMVAGLVALVKNS
jgi:hypothetical protein